MMVTDTKRLRLLSVFPKIRLNLIAEGTSFQVLFTGKTEMRIYPVCSANNAARLFSILPVTGRGPFARMNAESNSGERIRTGLTGEAQLLLSVLSAEGLTQTMSGAAENTAAMNAILPTDTKAVI